MPTELSSLPNRDLPSGIHRGTRCRIVDNGPVYSFYGIKLGHVSTGSFQKIQEAPAGGVPDPWRLKPVTLVRPQLP